MAKGLALQTVEYGHVLDRAIAIITAEWNASITHSLRTAAEATLLGLGWPQSKIHHLTVPGAFELTLGAKWMAERPDIEAVICLGCVVQGDTRHFEFICQAVAQGLTNLNIVSGKPIIFGVLTTDSFTQAEERAGGEHGNKGAEAAQTAAWMLAAREEMRTAGRGSSIGFARI